MKVTTIDTRHGTLNKRGFSNGNTLPYTGVPFGMNYFVLQNQAGSEWLFDPTYPISQGIRLTHQPSPWMGDFSSLLMTPITGEVPMSHPEGSQSSYKVQEAVFQPHYLRAELLRYQLLTEFVPTTRGGRMRLTNAGRKKIGLLLRTDPKAAYKIDKENQRVIGKLPQTVNDGQSILYFYFVLDVSGYSFEETISENGLALQFETSDKQLEVSLGTSFISEEQAVLNLEREVKHASFEELKNHAAEEWERHLKKIEVSDHDLEKVRDFNLYLYRMFLFPQTFYEWDQENQPIHFDVYQEAVQRGKFFTNNGYWDTYRTVYPLFSLILPEQYQDILEGIAHFYAESGHLPKWLSPDERGLMPGTLVNAVIADAAVKGLLDEKQMRYFLDAMVKEATTPPLNKRFGRSGVSDMLAYGYVTNQVEESVNQTQDNAYSDFCTRQVARTIGENDIADEYERKSLNYRHIFDENTGFMRGKDASGVFSEPFNPEEWSFDYTEGSAWQNSLAVFHNFQDYMDLFGGEERFLNHLIQLANTPPMFEVGSYGMEIHEMSEQAVADFGQIAISNQPSFHIPYLYVYVGKPEYTQHVVKQLCTHAFSKGFDGFPGDEDNGSMSGWFIFSSMGFYPVTPGVPEYVLGIPQFDEVKIALGNQKTFTIRVKDNLPQNTFVQAIQLNDNPHEKLYLKHKEITDGGEMAITLGLLPPARTYKKNQLPYSLANEQ